MHVRWSQVRGMPITDDMQEVVAFLSRPLIDPDTGKILGFFVLAPGDWQGTHQFLSVLDILSFGTRVHIRSSEKISPVDELIRMKKHLDDPRSVLGQPIRIRSTKKALGICGDIQFDTKYFFVEWLFPRGFFFYKQPIPVVDVVEITSGAIWIQNPLRGVKEKKVKIEKLPLLDVLHDAVPVQGRQSDRL